MSRYNGFYDLNIQSSNIDKWSYNHYSTVAFNHVIDLTQSPDQKKKKGGKTELQIPEPQKVKDSPKNMKILNRLTIVVNNVSQFPKVFQGKSSIIKKYDIIAVVPMEQACLQQACTMNDVDLICVDCQSRPTWNMNKKLYKTAVEQNKYFEICYGPALRDSSILKNSIYMTHVFHAVGRAKNLILSSGISDVFFLRSPYEVIYLSFLFGFGEKKGRAAIFSNPSNLVNRALKRRQGKSCISVSALSQQLPS